LRQFEVKIQEIVGQVKEKLNKDAKDQNLISTVLKDIPAIQS
jgi:hypothetical protein